MGETFVGFSPVQILGAFRGSPVPPGTVRVSAYNHTVATFEFLVTVRLRAGQQNTAILDVPPRDGEWHSIDLMGEIFDFIQIGLTKIEFGDPSFTHKGQEFHLIWHRVPCQGSTAEHIAFEIFA
jgi:hypothetical protein